MNYSYGCFIIGENGHIEGRAGATNELSKAMAHPNFQSFYFLGKC
jgi:hypothetical protein